MSRVPPETITRFLRTNPGEIAGAFSDPLADGSRNMVVPKVVAPCDARRYDSVG
jgi:hypothetical protein